MATPFASEQRWRPPAYALFIETLPLPTLHPELYGISPRLSVDCGSLFFSPPIFPVPAIPHLVVPSFLPKVSLLSTTKLYCLQLSGGVIGEVSFLFNFLQAFFASILPPPPGRHLPMICAHFFFYLFSPFVPRYLPSGSEECFRRFGDAAFFSISFPSDDLSNSPAPCTRHQSPQEFSPHPAILGVFFGPPFVYMLFSLPALRFRGQAW